MVTLLKAAWGAARNTVLFGLWCAFGGALIAVTFQLGYAPVPEATPPTTPPSTTVASITPADVRALTAALEQITTAPSVPPEATPLVDEAQAVLDDVRSGALPVEPPPTSPTTQPPPSTTSTVPETTVLTWPTP